MLVLKTRWLTVERYEHARPDLKTSIFYVRAKEGGGVLGEVRWFGRWRRYAFFPCSGTVFEPTCLRDIATFIDARMAERRGAKA